MDRVSGLESELEARPDEYVGNRRERRIGAEAPVSHDTRDGDVGGDQELHVRPDADADHIVGHRLPYGDRHGSTRGLDEVAPGIEASVYPGDPNLPERSDPEPSSPERDAGPHHAAGHLQVLGRETDRRQVPADPLLAPEQERESPTR